MLDFMRIAFPRKKSMSSFHQLPGCWSAGWAVCKAFAAAMLLEVLEAKKRYIPESMDNYFENVGGKMLDAVLVNMRINCRIAACGLISRYSLEQPEGVHKLMNLILKQARMEGFMVPNYYHKYPEFLNLVLPYYT